MLPRLRCWAAAVLLGLIAIQAQWLASRHRTLHFHVHLDLMPWLRQSVSKCRQQVLLLLLLILFLLLLALLHLDAQPRRWCCLQVQAAIIGGFDLERSEFGSCLLSWQTVMQHKPATSISREGHRRSLRSRSRPSLQLRDEPGQTSFLILVSALQPAARKHNVDCSSETL